MNPDERPAEHFLDPSLFKTDFDTKENVQNQYRLGFSLGNRSKTIYISVNSTWSADLEDGGHIVSYERIGYHCCTKDLLQGFLDSNCEIIVYRNGQMSSAMTIKESVPF